MTNASLAQSYLIKARVRLTILPVLFDAAAYSDVVREAQESSSGAQGHAPSGAE